MLFGLLLGTAPTFEIALVGDVMPGRFVEKRILREGDHKALEAVRAKLSSAALVLGNLEAPLTHAPFAKKKLVLLRADPARVNALKGVFTALSIANNHALDCGTAGLNDTVKALQKASIGIFGHGDAPWITTVHGVRIGVLGFSEFEDAGIGLVSQATTAIRQLRPKVDLLIVSVHWGIEGQPEASEKQRAWASEWCKAGADVIAGHHPHVWQNIQPIGSSTVFYSLGDFLFDSPVGPRRKTGIAFVKVVNGKVAGHRVVPVRIENGFPVLIRP